jgi:ligand-binding sensor domain-containing protein
MPIGKGTIVPAGQPILRESSFFRRNMADSQAYSINNILIAGDGRLWFSYAKYWFRMRDSLIESEGFLEHGIGYYEKNKIYTYETKQGFPDAFVNSINQDYMGNIWIGTADNGLICFDGKSFVSYDMTQGMPGNCIEGISFDAKGRMWFGSSSVKPNEHGLTGLNCFDGTRVLYYKNGGANSIAIDSTGKIWALSTKRGLSSFDGNKFTYYKEIERSVAHDFFANMQMDKKGNLWIQTSAPKLIKYNGKQFTTYNSEQIGTAYNIGVIYVDSENNIWLGTHNGLIRYTNGVFKPFYSEVMHRKYSGVKCIAQSKTGELFLGTAFDGIYYFDGKNFTPLSEKKE